jgi:hypothetical protein
MARIANHTTADEVIPQPRRGSLPPRTTPIAELSRARNSISHGGRGGSAVAGTL